jgi:signal transduction histidine kinase
MADAERLQQVFWNLIANAVKFSPEGGTVQITQRRVKSDVEVSIRDTGRGMQRDFLPKVFVPFMQAEDPYTRATSGLGLGLPISKQITELHGGTITAESAGLGKGATFTVRLPLARA